MIVVFKLVLKEKMFILRQILERNQLVSKLINQQLTNNLFLTGLQAVINPKVCAIGVQCSSSYRYDGVCIKDVGVQCSLLVFPASASTPLKHHLPSDTSQSESDADVEGGHYTSEYTLSQEDTSL